MAATSTGAFIAMTALILWVRVKRLTWLPGIFAGASLVAGVLFVVQLLTHYTRTDENLLPFAPLLIWGLWSIILPLGDRRFLHRILVLWMVTLGDLWA